MHIRSSSDILLKWKDMRNLDILLNLNDIRSTSDMKELSAIVPKYSYVPMHSIKEDG